MRRSRRNVACVTTRTICVAPVRSVFDVPFADITR